MKNYIIFLLIMLCCGFWTCGKTQSNPAVVPATLKNKYKFTHIALEAQEKSYYTDVYVPFLENGRYFIANYQGEKISRQSWEILNLMEYPFFIGINNGKLKFYRFPETLMLEHPIQQKKYIGMVGYSVEKNLYHDGIISITVDTAISFPAARPAPYPERLVEPMVPDTFQVTYYIGFDQQTKATECYFKLSDRNLKRQPFYRKATYGSEYMSDYVVVFTMRHGYNLVNMQGQQVFKDDFWDLVIPRDQYVIGKNKEGKFAVGNPANGIVSEFAFDTIETIRGCDSSFYGSQLIGTSLHWYLIKLDGSYIQVQEKLEDCKTIEVEEPYQSKPKGISIFNEKGKYGARNEMDSVVLQPEYDLMYTIQDKRWITVKKNGEYGVYHADGYWIFPVEPRKLFLESFTDSTGQFRLEENGHIILFNDQMEVFHEEPPIYFPNSYFNWTAIPDSLRPADINKIIRPKIYQQYMGFYDGTYSHVFDASGKYISSHRGKFTTTPEFQSLSFFKRKDGKEIPIGTFELDKQIYYVRMTDGFEYRK